MRELCKVIFIVAVGLLAACERESQPESKPPDAAVAPQPPTGPAPQGQPAPSAGTSQAPSPEPGQRPTDALTGVESLVAPIALYPDPLLAELVIASTYPLEVVQAARWLETKPDPETLKDQDWDASVMRLTEVPSVITMMNDHLDWTTQLGNAFLEDPQEVMGAIQVLRVRAVDSGFLKDSPEQKVVQETISAPAEEEAEEVISIEPAKSDTVYVPQYNPEAAYSASLAPPPAAYPAQTAAYTQPAPAGYYPTYYPSTTSSTDSLMTFGTGALVGGLMTWGIMELVDDDDDHWDHWDGGYHVVHPYGDAVCRGGNCWAGGGYRGNVNVDRGDINIDRDVNISGNEINLNRDRTFSQSELRRTERPTAWRHDPSHRRGQRYTERAKTRLGDATRPSLAGGRSSGLQGRPDADRGLGRAGERVSSDEVRKRLSQRSPERGKDNALAGIQRPAGQARFESKRGADSRRLAEARGRGEQVRRSDYRKSRPGGAISKPAAKRDRPARAQRTARRDSGKLQRQARPTRQRAAARPSAFEGSRNAQRTRSSSHRGAASRNRSAQARRSGGGGGRKGRRG